MMPMLTSRRVRRAALTTTAAAVVLGLGLTGCATGADDATEGEAGGGTVTLAVHDSFPNEEFAAAASAATGFDVQVVSAGDGGELTNKLVLTKGAPIADAFFGVDNIFASRLIENDVVVDHVPENMPENAEQFAVDGDPDSGLVPVDHGATCINIDTAWFADQQLEAPTTYDDLTKPEYRDLTVLLDPTASSTGASFLVGTVSEFGEDGFADYWQRLVDNGARIEQGWSDAYYGQFTQGGENGTKPIVVSYASSPAFTVDDAGTASSTAALLDTCTRQVEYAGVLQGAENEAGARAVVDYLVSNEFQQTIPDAMFMNPVDESVELPEAWSEFAPSPAAGQTHDLGSREIEAGRENWLKVLSEQIGL
ncbi:thiamine ABC transporter substrate-binding protein [Leucobacter sp. USCH14]|uniref:thiamine ABC transporter substrate-binding protein n=1 Tax=Leucobacter sp. USCH14 TaxID=3024838 RepID=UPI003099A4D0